MPTGPPGAGGAGANWPGAGGTAPPWPPAAAGAGGASGAGAAVVVACADAVSGATAGSAVATGSDDAAASADLVAPSAGVDSALEALVSVEGAEAADTDPSAADDAGDGSGTAWGFGSDSLMRPPKRSCNCTCVLHNSLCELNF